MIKFNDGLEICFSNMGKFIGGKNWKHPYVSTPTYEIIFVTDGEVFLEEDGCRMHLKKGDLLCLRANTRHGGYQSSDYCSFFWLHFFADRYDEIGMYQKKVRDSYNAELLFKELNHWATLGKAQEIIECRLLAFLMELKNEREESGKLFSDLCEYIRVYVDENLSVQKLAKRFGYSSDHLSKVCKAGCGLSLKEYLMRERNTYVKNLLLCTSMSIKEIAGAACFEDDNAFLKFFKYINKMTPTQFRNQYYASHINKR